MVLIIDDEAHIREVIQDSLNFSGIDSVAADSGANGLALFEQHPAEIDVVILDLTMPGINGQETLRRLRERAPTVPVILSSGIGEADLIRLTRQDRAVIHLAKPFTLDTLLAAVQSAQQLQSG
jgi:CheY-like chemotaxis protein